jgi:hypothetical protein
MIDDAIPQLIVVDERSKRKTTEFCTEKRAGYRCMLVKGHDGDHEAVAKAGAVRWGEPDEETVVAGDEL